MPGVELVPSFTQTTATENISMQVTVMDVAKNYFEYKMTTICGYPKVILEGTLEDWQLIRVNAE